MSIGFELLILQVVIVGGWVVAVHGRRLRRLERTPRSPLSAQIGTLQDQVRALQAEHEQGVRVNERFLRELGEATEELEADLRVVARRVDLLIGEVEQVRGPAGPAGRERERPHHIPPVTSSPTFDRRAS